MRKLFSILLCLALLVSMFCFTVYATENNFSVALSDTENNDDSYKSCYVDHVERIELPPIYATSVVDLPITVEEGEKVIKANEDAMIPYGPTSTSLEIPYRNKISDLDHNFMAMYTITINGTIYGYPNRAVIDSVSVTFTYTATSNYSYSINKQGNSATVRILHDGSTIARHNFTLNTDSSLTVT